MLLMCRIWNIYKLIALTLKHIPYTLNAIP